MSLNTVRYMTKCNIKGDIGFRDMETHRRINEVFLLCPIEAAALAAASGCREGDGCGVCWRIERVIDAQTPTVVCAVSAAAGRAEPEALAPDSRRKVTRSDFESGATWLSLLAYDTEDIKRGLR
jgi:hypothetical protein